MSNRLTVLFILQPHFSLLAFTAAADALTTANLVQNAKRYQLRTASLDDKPVVSDLGIHIHADVSFDLVQTEQVDHIIVCGGYRCARDENPLLSQLLVRAHNAGASLGGLWNGSLALAHAQLMNGFSCALHPDDQDYAAKRFPDLLVRADALVIDRTRVSAAGPNSSFDLMLMIIQRVDSSDTVVAIRNILRADISQPPDTNDSHAGYIAKTLPEKLQRALQLMRNNLDENLNRDDLATHLNMSTRAMERMFQKHLNTSPARQYMEMRLLRAHEMLRQSNDTVTSIAQRCGFVSSAHFSRAFSKRFGCSPKTLRQPTLQLID